MAAITLILLWGCFYSLSCETYSGTPADVADAHGRGVSIRCLARRTAEHWFSTSGRTATATFLFAVLRDVQRNCTTKPSPTKTPDRFYSLSCETYSGTRAGQLTISWSSLLFAVLRDVQRNMGQSGNYRAVVRFLFAVLRDVQRNAIELCGLGLL